MYELAQQDALTKGASKLSVLLKERALEDGFTARAVQRKKPSIFKNAEAAKKAWNELVDAGWLCERRTASGKGQRPTSRYFINQKIFTSSCQ